MDSPPSYPPPLYLVDRYDCLLNYKNDLCVPLFNGHPSNRAVWLLCSCFILLFSSFTLCICLVL